MSAAKAARFVNPQNPLEIKRADLSPCFRAKVGDVIGLVDRIMVMRKTPDVILAQGELVYWSVATGAASFMRHSNADFLLGTAHRNAEMGDKIVDVRLTELVAFKVT